MCGGGRAVAVVVLVNECSETFYAIGHPMGGWKWKLAQHAEEHAQQEHEKPVEKRHGVCGLRWWGRCWAVHGRLALSFR